MTDLVHTLSSRLAAAFAAEGLNPELGAVKRSDRPDLAPFQCNGALVAAKTAGKPPMVIAAAIAKRVEGGDGIASVEIAGPGFLNIAPTDVLLAARAQYVAGHVRAGAALVENPRRVIVDYGGPNVAKPMHVGHLRASIIGESIKRLFRFRGDTVWGDAHFGDWGFQMGLLIADYEVRFGAIDPDASRGKTRTFEIARAGPPCDCKAARRRIAKSGRTTGRCRWLRKRSISTHSASISTCGRERPTSIR